MNLANIAQQIIANPDCYCPLTRTVYVKIPGDVEYALLFKAPELPVFVPEIGPNAIGILTSPHDNNGKTVAGLHLFSHQLGDVLRVVASAAKADKLKPVTNEQPSIVPTAHPRRPGLFRRMSRIIRASWQAAVKELEAAR